jgi:CubicO group peptidase (beta-lactamase class C family)
MKSLFALLLSLIPISVPAAPVLPASSMPAIDRYVAQRMEQQLIPGLALVVIRNGEVVHRRGFGELDTTQPIIIGSLSKAITATAVMTLVEDGKLELDAPMQRYLPGQRFDDPGMRSVTVRHLLNQTSGIPAEAKRAEGHDATLAAHAEALQGVRLVATPGERHIYSSPNYQLLGRIVEVVSGQSFGAYVQARILDPLRMNSSSVTGAENAVAGHNIWWGMPGPSTYRWEPGRLPTASIVASADDLGRFVLSQLGEGPPILGAESREILHRGVGKTDYFSYAMGWREGTTAGVPSLWHGGALPSYRGAVVMLPQSTSGVIVLTNMSTMFGDHTREIAAGVVALMEQRPLPETGRPLRDVYMAIAAGSLLLLLLGAWGLVRATRRPGGNKWKTIAFDVLLPVAAIATVPRFVHVPYVAMWEGAPDITLTVFVTVLLGFATAGVKLFRKQRSPA